MDMLRKFIFLGLLVAAGSPVVGQNYNADRVDRPNTKKINIGIKAGFNSSMFMVSELKIKDVTIDEVQNNYKIGYFGALFMRINMKKHFIQPEVSYNVSKCEITFDKLGSQHPAIEPDYASVQSVLHSVDFPVLYGYNVVKKDLTECLSSQVPSFATYGESTMKSLLRISTKRVFTKSCIRSMSAQ